MNYATGEVTKADERELAAMLLRHKDIQRHGGGILEVEQAKRERQRAMERFVDLHGLKCFRCGSGFNAWAKTAVSEHGRPWAVCQVCVRRPRAADVPPAETQNPANSE